MAEAGLLEWADKQHDWIRDALRRHAARPGFLLEEEDKTGIAAQVRHIGGFELDEPPECSPLAAEHLKASSSNEPQAVLCSLGPVKHLNRLAEEQQLRFATDGVTIIYGDNGSGKSGYCRIAKKLCRSLTADDLLGNVFEIGAKPPAEVLVRFLEKSATEPTAITWKDGTQPPAPIARISVFDSANARLYVDKHNRIGFLPAAIALLERHGLHRGELEAGFREEIKAIEKKLKTSLPGGYAAAGAVAKLLARLEIKSKEAMPSAEEIKNLAAVSEQETAELAGLEQVLASDPSTMAAKRRRAKAALERLLTASEQIDEALSVAAIETYRNLYATAESTAQAAKLAASGAFATMPLTGVGLSPWRLMFDHARAYAARVSGFDHQHLPDQEGDRCMLCQEPMTADAAERVRAFNDFVTGAANKAAQSASAAHGEALRRIKELVIASEDAIEAALGEFGDLSAKRKELMPLIVAYCGDAGKRRDAIAAIITLADFTALPLLGDPIAPKVRTEVEVLEAEALADDKAAANDGNRATDRARRDALKDRKKLSDDLAVILARLADLEERRKLLACCDAVETGSVSRQMTSLRRSLVMENLEKRIVAEIEALALTHIPFAVNDRSQDGQSYFEVGLNAAKAIANSKVLSEGEQRALALACFLAEVGGDTSRQGMIIDDPVSSLDHVRIRRVAARLVKEAATGRQIIIFTHNLLFFNEVVDAAAQASPAIPLVRNYINKSEAAGFGLISETDEPWIAQSVTKRIDTLKARQKEYDGVTDFATEAW
ncbi:MAG TPA: AAA family ATPase, partial [Afipia sp.]